jgi:glycosyltransferase involved in cell wall biosynthesis
MKNVLWSIAIPVLNEGHALGKLIERLYRLPQIKRCEVIVVDGGSTDNTRDVFIHAARTHPRLYLIDAPGGKSIGLRRAFARAHGRYIAFMDGDLQYSPSDLPKLMKKVEQGADLAVSRRKLAWADNSIRRLASQSFSRLSRMLLGLPVSDPQSGMKAFRASLLSKLCLTSYDWGIDIELISQALRQGAKIEEVEIEFHPRQAGKAKTSLLSTSFDLLRTTLQQLIRQKKQQAAGLAKKQNGKK